MSKTKKELQKRDEATPVAVTPPPTVTERRVSFEQWAARRGIKVEHRRGMRAFISNPDRVRTMSAWDEAFKAY